MDDIIVFLDDVVMCTRCGKSSKNVLCNACQVTMHRHLKLKKLWDVAGYRCASCEYCKGNSQKGVLVFHHMHDKKFGLNSKEMNRGWDLVVEEALKCIPLCPNCHSEVHVGLIEKDDIEKLYRDFWNKDKTLRLRKLCEKNMRPVRFCKDCGKQIYAYGKSGYCSKCIFAHKINTRKPKKVECEICGETTRNKRFCSTECSSKGSRRVERPSKEQLELLVWSIPTTKIAKSFGVSDVAVSKWCKIYEIDKPPRGYWAKMEGL